jgi:hypothetical protein
MRHTGSGAVFLRDLQPERFDETTPTRSCCAVAFTLDAGAGGGLRAGDCAGELGAGGPCSRAVSSPERGAGGDGSGCFAGSGWGDQLSAVRGDAFCVAGGDGQCAASGGGGGQHGGHLDGPDCGCAVALCDVQQASACGGKTLKQEGRKRGPGAMVERRLARPHLSAVFLEATAEGAVWMARS